MHDEPLLRNIEIHRPFPLWSEHKFLAQRKGSRDAHFAVNSRAVVLMMAEFARRQIEHGKQWGRIINVSTDGSAGFVHLAGRKMLVNIFQDTLTLEYRESPLSRYSVEWQPDEKHFLRVGNPRLYDHPYQSPQPSLWEPGEVEWYVIIRTDPPVRRRKRKGQIVLITPPLFADGT